MHFLKTNIIELNLRFLHHYELTTDNTAHLIIRQNVVKTKKQLMFSFFSHVLMSKKNHESRFSWLKTHIDAAIIAQ